jgi:hypothetical protein
MKPAFRIKILRGEILFVLHLFASGLEDKPFYPDHPWRLPARSLKLYLEGRHQLPSDDELDSILRYLSGKNYVEVAWLNDGKGGFEYVEITTKGVDLMDGTLADDGIAVLRRT